jgi:uncharacterized protein (DUF58 family)
VSASPIPLGRPTPTRRGWLLASGATVLTISAIVAGNGALAGLGIAGFVLLAYSHLIVLRGRPSHSVQRIPRPSRTHVGAECRVSIEGRTLAHNPLLMLTELVDDGLRVARFALPPGPPDTPVRATYRVPTTRRGRHELGPLIAFVIDPFGLARREWEVASVSELIVRPRVHVVESPGRGRGGEIDLHAAGKRQPTHQTAAEFLALREYEAGDDPRRVNWRATARRGELMVRQDEAAAPGRVVLVLDVRPRAFDGPSFETAVEAIASIAVQASTDQIPVEAIATSGELLGRPAPGQLDALLDGLAIIEFGGPDHLRALCAQLSTRLGIGAVIVVTGAPDRELTRSVAPLVGRCVLSVVATRPPSTSETVPGLVDASSQPFAAAWNRAVALSRHPRSGGPWTRATSRSPLHSPR